MLTINSQKLSNIQFHYKKATSEEFTFERKPMANWYEMFYLIKGKLHFMLRENESFPLPEDSLLLIPPNIPCKSFAANSEEIEYLHIGFHGNLLAAERQKILLSLFDENYIGKENYYTEISDTPLIHSIHYFLTKQKNSELFIQMRYALNIENMLAYLYEYEINHSILSPLPDQYSQKISTVLKYIQFHLCEPLSVSNIAQALYWDEIYIQKKFKKEVGISLHQYIIQERILLAQTLIRECEKDSPNILMEIAETTGFSTYSTFYRNFLKVTGHSPMEELKQSQKNEMQKNS